MKSEKLYLLIILFCLGLGWMARGFYESQATVIGETSRSPRHKSNRELTYPNGSDSSEKSNIDSTGSKGIKQPNLIDFNLSPYELIIRANQIEDGNERVAYLRKLVAGLVERDPTITSALKQHLSKYIFATASTMSVEAHLAGVVAQLADPIVHAAWKDNHAFHPARLEIFNSFSWVDTKHSSPQLLMKSVVGWTPWEKEQYYDKLLVAWADSAPTDAQSLIELNPNNFRDEQIRSVYCIVANKNFEELEENLAGLTDSRLRKAAVQALATALHEDTTKALNWADSLGSQEARDWAHEQIYNLTPRGIGVLLNQSNGHVVVGRTLRENTGLLEGDRIVSVTESNGQLTNLYRENISKSIAALRGEPGSVISLQVLRLQEGGKGYQQIEITMDRAQTYLEKESGSNR